MPGPRRIAVIGSGTSAWMAGAYLARILKRLGTEIIQVPFPEPYAAAPVRASMPSLESFHRALGFDLRDLMRSVSASFRLGTEYAATGGIHAYGDTGAAFGTVAFHLAWRAHGEDISPAAFSAYSLGALAARAGRFAPPLEDGPPGSGYSPGLHMDAAAYQRYMQRAALHYGVIPAAPLAGTEIDPDADMLQLADGSQIECDLILDTVGCGAYARDTEPFPLLAGPVSWRFGVKAASEPLGLSRFGESAGYPAVDVPADKAVFRALICPSPAAEHRASAILRREGFEPVRESDVSNVLLGTRRAHWTGRVVLIGEAACLLPPVEAADLRVVQLGLETLLPLLPAGHPDIPERAEYNRLMRESLQALTDFVSLAFAAPGSPLENLPPSLRLRLQNFTSRGRIILTDGESLTRESWASALIAAGWQMRRVDAHAASLPEARVRASLRAMASTLAATAETLPDQRAWLRRAGLIPSQVAGAG